MKSWSSSYSYTSNGKNSSETFQKSFNDGHIIYEDGYSRTKDNELKEKFYKKEKQVKSNNEKSLLGKSKNKGDWELLGIKDGQKTYKKQKYVDVSKQYIERPSSSHRLTRYIKDSPFEKKQNKLLEYNTEEKLNSMFQELNLSMFDNDDFFKF